MRSSRSTEAGPASTRKRGYRSRCGTSPPPAKSSKQVEARSPHRRRSGRASPSSSPRCSTPRETRSPSLNTWAEGKERGMRRCSLWLLLLAVRGEAQETRFKVSFPAAVHAEPITGRVYVMISKTNHTEPRLQISQTGGTPFFGRDVERLPPGAAALLYQTH